MQHKFPFVSLHIQMEGNDLDVNVHPSKMEVRFARGTEVYDAVYETVHKALTTREMIQTVPFGKEEPIKKAAACGQNRGMYRSHLKPDVGLKFRSIVHRL